MAGTCDTASVRILIAGVDARVLGAVFDITVIAEMSADTALVVVGRLDHGDLAVNVDDVSGVHHADNAADLPVALNGALDREVCHGTAVDISEESVLFAR